MPALASIQVPQAVKQLDKDYRLETLEYEHLVLHVCKWQISGRRLNTSLTHSGSSLVFKVETSLMLSGEQEVCRGPGWSQTSRTKQRNVCVK